LRDDNHRSKVMPAHYLFQLQLIVNVPFSTSTHSGCKTYSLEHYTVYVQVYSYRNQIWFEHLSITCTRITAKSLIFPNPYLYILSSLNSAHFFTHLASWLLWTGDSPIPGKTMVTLLNRAKISAALVPRAEIFRDKTAHPSLISFRSILLSSAFQLQRFHVRIVAQGR